MSDHIIKADGCWSWSGCHRLQDVRPLYSGEYAYRSVWRLVHGDPVPSVLHHECENKACVRPEPGHVSALATQSEHAAQHLAERNRQRGAERTHCKNGHPLEGENLRTVNSSRDGVYRRCAICSAAAKRKYRSKNQ